MKSSYPTPPEIEAFVYACAIEHPAWSCYRIHKNLIHAGISISRPTIHKLLKKIELEFMIPGINR